MAGFKFKLEQGSGSTAKKSRPTKRWFVILGALVALVAVAVIATLFIRQQNLPALKPSDEFMSRSLKALDADDTATMSSLSKEITNTDRYESSSEYLVLLTYFSLATNDANAASASLGQLKKLDAEQFTQTKWASKSDVVKDLEYKLKVLKEFKEAEKGRKSGFEGSP